MSGFSWVSIITLAAALVGALVCGVWVGNITTRSQLEQTCIKRFAVDFTGAVRMHPDSSSGRPVLLTMPSKPVTQHPRPECTSNTLVFELYNGTRVPPADILKVVKGTPSPGIMQVTALGECGGFFKPATQLLLRTGSNSTDVDVMGQIFLKDEFSWLDMIFPDRSQVRRIMDFGSNCGMTLLMFSLMYSHAKLIGVEPEIHNFGVLVLNTQHNPNIFLQRGAAGAHLRLDKLQVVAPGSWGFGVKPAEGMLQEDTVFPSFTVPFLLDKYGWPDIDLLKVDIEGSELELCEDVLAGARWLERVRCISFEMHDRLFPQMQPRDRISRTCEKAMQKAGMFELGNFQELRCWCRVSPELQQHLERNKALLKANG